jgi:hypothetical protein
MPFMVCIYLLASTFVVDLIGERNETHSVKNWQWWVTVERNVFFYFSFNRLIVNELYLNLRCFRVS